jgi:3D (Asp-Asp-Asp) domain-containing protein
MKVHNKEDLKYMLTWLGRGFFLILIMIFSCWLSHQINADLYGDLKNQNIIIEEKSLEIVKLTKEKEEIEKIIENKDVVINELQVQYGKLAEQNELKENTIKKLMSVGTKPQNYKEPEKVSSRGTFDRHKDNMVYEGEWLGTSYTPRKEECGNDKGITASGKPVIAGYTIAIDPKYWSFGTKFYIEGVGIVEAWDTGSAIKGRNRFDLCMFNLDYAKQGSFKAKVWRIVE